MDRPPELFFRLCRIAVVRNLVTSGVPREQTDVVVRAPIIAFARIYLYSPQYPQEVALSIKTRPEIPGSPAIPLTKSPTAIRARI